MRIHGVDTDFADFCRYSVTGSTERHGRLKVSYCVLEDGYGDACSLSFPCKNGEPCETVGRQANKHDLAKYAANDKLKGFFHGFVQHQKRRFTTETFYTDYKYYRRYMVSYKEILEAVRYGEAWYRPAQRFNSYPRREPSFLGTESYPDGMGGWAEVPESESRAPMDWTIMRAQCW